MDDNIVKFQRDTTAKPINALTPDVDMVMHNTMELMAEPYMNDIHISDIYDRVLEPLIRGYINIAGLHPVVKEHMKSAIVINLLASRIIHVDNELGAVASSLAAVSNIETHQYTCTAIKLTADALTYMQVDTARAYKLYSPILQFGTAPAPIGLDKIRPIKNPTIQMKLANSYELIRNGTIPTIALEQIGIVLPENLCTLLKVIKLNRTFVFIVTDSLESTFSHKIIDDITVGEVARLGDQVIVMTDKGQLINHVVIGI